ncbi:MAG: leucyl aminopeptidase [Actinomycetales bacterium]|nr:leucyl aminopeptidase [Actinomycetales bacterium]
MTSSKLTVTTKLPSARKDSIIVVGAVGKAPDLKLVDSGIASSLVAQGALNSLNLEGLGVTSNFESITRAQAADGTLIAIVGLGSQEPSVDQLRALGGSITRTLSNFAKVIIDVPVTNGVQASALLEGAAIGNYLFEDYKGTKKGLKLKEIALVTAKKVSPAEIERITVLAGAVHATRDLVNTPPNELYPAAVAAHVNKHTRGLPLKVTVWDEKKLAADKMVGILSVGSGSVRGPRLVKIEYAPKGAKASLALVGKGITFDSGGLSLKPPTSMIGMKYDMTGAATVYQAILAIAKLGLNVKVSAYLCLAENLPSGSATRPNDIIRYRNGKTVEITNTDAEGRLVLADGLISASNENPDLIVDVATLTGAATVALGNRYAGLMGVGTGVQKIQDAAALAGELVWHMPLAEELKKNLEGETADLINAKLGNPAGGMIVGGLFLQEFVGYRPGAKGSEPNQIDWAHLDIAGPANNDAAPYGYIGKGASGSYVRTLVALAERAAK